MVSEGDVADREGNCVGFGASWFCVFADSKQVVESHVYEVSFGSLFGRCCGCCLQLLEKVVGDPDRHCQLWA